MPRRAPLAYPLGAIPRAIIKPANPVLLPQHPLSRGLVACWLLGEGGQVAQAKDIGPSALHGTLTNFPANPRSGSHHGGNALTFDGTNDYIQVPYDPILNCLSGLSLCAWVFRTTANDRTIFGKPFTTTNVSPFWDYSLAYFGGSGFTLRIGLSSSAFAGGATNVWEHWVVTADGANWKWYLNSKLVKTQAVATLPTNTNSQGVKIGINASLAEPWAGREEGLRIYNRALTLSEVGVLFAEPYAGILDATRPMFRVGAAAASGVTGTIAVTEANDVLAATGSVQTVGSIATTEAADVLAATGFLGFTGTIATTEANDMLAATGKVLVRGTAPLVEAGDVLAATGTVSQPAISGTIAATETGDTLAAFGSSGSLDRGGWGHVTKKQRAKLRREAAAQRKRVTDGWDQSQRDQSELREQIMRGLRPEVLGIALPVGVSDDEDEEEIEMLLMAA